MTPNMCQLSAMALAGHYNCDRSISVSDPPPTLQKKNGGNVFLGGLPPRISYDGGGFSLSNCACFACSLILWAGALWPYLFVLVAPILWPSAPAPSVPIRFCLLRLFSGVFGWRPVFLFVCACCAYSLAFWAGGLCSYPFVLLAPVFWSSGLLCLLRLCSGHLGWRPLFLFVCACCTYFLPSVLAPSVHICLCMSRLFSVPWAGGLYSCTFVLVAFILWPCGLAASCSIRLCMLRLFCGPLLRRPLFLSVCACCTYSLALWVGTLCSHPFVLVAPILWPSGLAPCSRPFLFAAPILWHFRLAPCVPIRLCLLRLFPGPLGERRLFLFICACCAYSLALWVGALSSRPFLLVVPILWPSGWRPLFFWASALCSYPFVLSF